MAWNSRTLKITSEAASSRREGSSEWDLATVKAFSCGFCAHWGRIAWAVSVGGEHWRFGRIAWAVSVGGEHWRFWRSAWPVPGFSTVLLTRTWGRRGSCCIACIKIFRSCGSIVLASARIQGRLPTYAVSVKTSSMITPIKVWTLGRQESISWLADPKGRSSVRVFRGRSTGTSGTRLLEFGDRSGPCLWKNIRGSSPCTARSPIIFTESSTLCALSEQTLRARGDRSQGIRKTGPPHQLIQCNLLHHQFGAFSCTLCSPHWVSWLNLSSYPVILHCCSCCVLLLGIWYTQFHFQLIEPSQFPWSHPATGIIHKKRGSKTGAATGSVFGAEITIHVNWF